MPFRSRITGKSRWPGQMCPLMLVRGLSRVARSRVSVPGVRRRSRLRLVATRQPRPAHDARDCITVRARNAPGHSEHWRVARGYITLRPMRLSVVPCVLLLLVACSTPAKGPPVTAGGANGGANAGGKGGKGGAVTGVAGQTVQPGVGGSAGSAVWRKSSLTTYESYPAPGSAECVQYNGCTWAGQFAAVDGVMTEDWVKAHNIASVHSKDYPTYRLKTLRLRSGAQQIDVVVYDMCADTDCDGCCTANAASTGFLIDLEKYTAARFGLSDGVIEWTCLDC